MDGAVLKLSCACQPGINIFVLEDCMFIKTDKRLKCCLKTTGSSRLHWVMKPLCLAVNALFLVGMLAAGGQSSGRGAATQAPTASAPIAKGDGTSPYTSPNFPLFPQKTTLKYFVTINGAMSATMRDYNGVAFFQKLEEASNVHIEWIHPASGSAGNEQFAIMVASNDLPDLINWPFGNARGGAEALLRDRVILPISQQDAYAYLPNYMALVDANEPFKQSTLLDDGTFFQLVSFNYDWDLPGITEFQIKGPYIRMDWVRKVGKQTPTTLDEFHDVLLAIKNSNVNGKGVGAVVPFVVDRNLEAIRALAGLFGTRWGDPHMQNGKVVYGPMTENYKTYVETMALWYREGLINADFPVVDNVGALILSSDAASTLGSMGSGLTMGRTALLASDPSSDLDSIPYPKGPYGHQSLVDDVWRNPRATAITSANRHPVETMKWLNYFYTYQGSIDSTFGVVGESYNMVNGKPILSDAVMRPTNGYNQEEATARYNLGPINFPYARHIEFYRQVNLVTEQQQRIQTNWKTGTRDILLPPITLSPDESTSYSNLMSDIKTYVDEMTVRFIVGQVPLTRYSEFVQSIRNMNIDRAVAIYQTAVDRYNARNK
jgi:putative aldouronate transport system substrate-binding protein